jgi:predicted metal-dependent peptidase
MPTQAAGAASQAAPAASLRDIAKAARYTLLSMDQHRSIGQLALRYLHEANASTSHIAYATDKKCVYGPRFAAMCRFSQTFVVAHETMHHALGHIEHGALLYKREGARFSPLGFNIAADAIINYVLEVLPDVDKLGTSIRYGVRRCQEFGIVNWDKLVAEVTKISKEMKVAVDPIFALTPDRLSVTEIYYALKRLAKQQNDQRAGGGKPSNDNGEGSDESNQNEGSADPRGVIERLAEELDAHDDLSDAIKEQSRKSEGELIDTISRQEDALRRIQAGCGSGDALLRVKRPDGLTRTPWPQALRRIANNALVHRPSVDHKRPSRRVVSQLASARDPRTPEALRSKGIAFQPRTSNRINAKKCVIILDTSGSMFADKQLIEDCIREMQTICKRVVSSLTIIFADAEVCEVVTVEDSFAKIAELVPKGGLGTDFRPAIELAETLQPDLIVYLTDLCGTFPERAPRVPIIWGYPPAYENVEVPFGKRLPLHP